MLVDHLVATGREARIVRRPDREPHTGKAVDAELHVDGRLVAIDVTLFAHGARALVETGKLTDQVSEALGPTVRRLPLGRVVVDIVFARLPPSAIFNNEVTQLTETIDDALAELALSAETRVEVSPTLPVDWVAGLRVVRLGREGSSLGWMVSSVEVGGNLTEIAGAWVKDRLVKKASQAYGYSEAWLLIVDRYGLVDAHGLARAIEENAELVPNNWRAVWLIPATAPATVVSVALP